MQSKKLGEAILFALTTCALNPNKTVLNHSISAARKNTGGGKAGYWLDAPTAVLEHICQ